MKYYTPATASLDTRKLKTPGLRALTDVQVAEYMLSGDYEVMEQTCRACSRYFLNAEFYYDEATDSMPVCTICDNLDVITVLWRKLYAPF